MNIPDDALALIKLREGFENEVYRDSLGKITGGWGHLLHPSEIAQYPVGTQLTDETCEVWLENDCTNAMIIAQHQYAAINFNSDTLFSALICVAFQMGTDLQLKFLKTWKLLTQHEWELAAIEVEKGSHGLNGDKSLWFVQTPTRVQDFQKALRSL